MGLRVDFYLLPTTTTTETFKYACRLAEKSYLNHQKTLIWTASKTDAENINAGLWTFKDISFVPHSIYNDKSMGNIPILIAFENPPMSREILINLTEGIPPFFNHFNRIIEIVPDQADALTHNRTKYRTYRDNGCEIFSHNLKNPTT